MGGFDPLPCLQVQPRDGRGMIEIFGADRIWVNSAADWGVSDPLATLKAANEMRMRGHPEGLIKKVFYENPKTFLSQCPKFEAS